MPGCGCSKQSGGGSKRCSCKKCRRYSQRGGGFLDFFGSSPAKDPSSVVDNTRQPSNEEKICILKKDYDELLARPTQVANLEPEIVPTRGGGGGGNMMARQNFGLRGGYGELVTTQDEATIGLYSGPSIATQGIATQQGGKRRTRKIRKTRRMKKSRKHIKSRKYRR
jgi:hypothetical protein